MPLFKVKIEQKITDIFYIPVYAKDADHASFVAKQNKASWNKDLGYCLADETKYGEREVSNCELVTEIIQVPDYWVHDTNCYCQKDPLEEKTVPEAYYDLPYDESWDDEDEEYIDFLKQTRAMPKRFMTERRDAKAKK